MNAEWLSVSCRQLHPERSGVLGGAIFAPRGGEAGESFLAGKLSPAFSNVGVILKTEVDGSVQEIVNFSGQK